MPIATSQAYRSRARKGISFSFQVRIRTKPFTISSVDKRGRPSRHFVWKCSLKNRFQERSGRSKNGNFVISEVEIEISETEDFKESQSLVFASAKADHEQPSGKPFVAAQAIDGKLDTGWAIAPQMGKEHCLN